MSNKKQLITVCALIHKKVDGVNKIFLAKRAETKQFLPGVFELPGGHVEFDEPLTDALKREIMEEFGAEIVVGDPFSAFTYTNNVKQSHSVEIVYFAQFVDEAQVNLKPEDHSEGVWVSEHDIQKAYTTTKGQDDKEFVIARRGLGILNGQPLRFS